MMPKNQPARAMHLLPEQARTGFSTCCAAPPVYAVSITFQTRNRYDELQLKTNVRRLCQAHGRRYASTFGLQLPREDSPGGGAR